ncbi:uncharacterized protein LOC129578094 isoform X2 [Sitodiplosis mosellana]|uniref:uncharacterized protein LOC129578094 isoform X2 n=1 Tax=Sitodiplosis mosellana TaxID=263140 RepID=UPI002444FFEF|nr:uncharacterized protein LOC129578094 isoform X2 [Sitodiplosis mosellana]
MHIVRVLFAISMSLVLVSGQFLGTYDNSYRLGFDSFNDDFRGSSLGGSNSFGGFSGLASIRDPRQNRGPVQFPQGPTDGPVESSGVIVGASGYGFVPPNSQQSRLVAPTQNRFNNRYFNQFRFF